VIDLAESLVRNWPDRIRRQCPGCAAAGPDGFRKRADPDHLSFCGTRGAFEDFLCREAIDGGQLPYHKPFRRPTGRRNRRFATVYTMHNCYPLDG